MAVGWLLLVGCWAPEEAILIDVILFNIKAFVQIKATNLGPEVPPFCTRLPVAPVPDP
jgi:hypothetical protein